MRGRDGERAAQSPLVSRTVAHLMLCHFPRNGDDKSFLGKRASPLGVPVGRNLLASL